MEIMKLAAYDYDMLQNDTRVIILGQKPGSPSFCRMLLEADFYGFDNCLRGGSIHGYHYSYLYHRG